MVKLQSIAELRAVVETDYDVPDAKLRQMASTSGIHRNFRRRALTNKRSSGTPSPSVIDREWPHQVALPDDLCVMRNYTLIREFCSDNGLEFHTRQVQAIWPNRDYENYRLHCFADRAAAELFQAHFGGDFFDPKRDRENGRVRAPWRRQGTRTRILRSGPLEVPELLRK